MWCVLDTFEVYQKKCSRQKLIQPIVSLIVKYISLIAILSSNIRLIVIYANRPSSLGPTYKC